MTVQKLVGCLCWNYALKCMLDMKKAENGPFCNTPKYTLVVFDMFRVFCKPNLNVS